MLTTQPENDTKAKRKSRVGLALAGGGPLGLIYEIGAVMALNEALEGVDFNDLDVYVGVSAGAANASTLANGFPPAKICSIFVNNESDAFPLDPQHFLRPAFGLYAKGISAVPGLLIEALWGFLMNPHDRTLLAALSKLSRAIPPGLLNNDSIAVFLEKLFGSRGRTNDFRKLKRKLYVIATDLDTGEIVKLGAEGYDHIPISKAVQASTALPGLYPPVELEDRYYVDGGLKKTVHASTALNAGVDLLFCINPIVPFNANHANPEDSKYEKLTQGGLPVVMTQTFYAIIHSRMQVGMAGYANQYPDKDMILFEPNGGDAKMFFANVFSFANRHKVCEHAYQTTRNDMRARQKELKPLLAQHGIKLRTDILEDTSRHFDSHLHIPSEVAERARLQNKVTNSLSDALDDLQEWIRTSKRDIHLPPSAVHVNHPKSIGTAPISRTAASTSKALAEEPK